MTPLPLENGIDHHHPDHQNPILGFTPLIEATILNRLDLMLEHTFNLDMLSQSDSLGNTPLHYAVETGFTQGVILLTNQGCQLEIFNLDYLTPLMLALKKHHISIAEFLIKKGASPYLLSSKYESALNMAIEMRQHELVEFMLSYDEVPEVKLPSLYVACLAAAKCDRIEYIDPLINAGANLNLPFYDVVPPLIMSVIRNNLEMVKAWLSHGAPLEKYDLCGFTPLMVASFAGHLDMCKVLIDHGARVSTVSGDCRYTAHSLALENNQFQCAAYLATLMVPQR